MTAHQLSILDDLVWDASRQLRALVRRRDELAASLGNEAARLNLAQLGYRNAAHGQRRARLRRLKAEATDQLSAAAAAERDAA